MARTAHMGGTQLSCQTEIGQHSKFGLESIVRLIKYRPFFAGKSTFYGGGARDAGNQSYRKHMSWDAGKQSYRKPMGWDAGNQSYRKPMSLRGNRTCFTFYVLRGPK